MKKYTTDGLFGMKITRRISDDWINASLICKEFGITFEVWMQSEFGTKFLKHFFATNDYKESEVIERGSRCYFISQVLMIGLCSSLSDTFFNNYLQWDKEQSAGKVKAIDFNYTIENTKFGKYRQNLTFYPVIGMHTLDDILTEQDEAEERAKNVGMGFTCTIKWVTQVEPERR